MLRDSGDSINHRIITLATHLPTEVTISGVGDYSTSLKARQFGRIHRDSLKIKNRGISIFKLRGRRD